MKQQQIKFCMGFFFSLFLFFTSNCKNYHYVCLSFIDPGECKWSHLLPDCQSFLNGRINSISWQIQCIIHNPVWKKIEDTISPVIVIYKPQYYVKISLDPLPVSEVSFPPLGHARKGAEVTNVRNPTSGLAYHLQSVRVQLPCHFQPQEPLHFLYFFNYRTTVLSSNKLFHIPFKVVVVFEVLLAET